MSDTEALRASVDKILDRPLVGADAAEPEEDEANSRRNPVFTFDFHHATARGKVYTGTFTNSVLTAGQEAGMGVVIARVTGGAPWESLPEDVQRLARAIAHLTLSLNDSDGNFTGPAWARDLRKVLDVDVILALFNEALLHENTFFRVDAPPETSA